MPGPESDTLTRTRSPRYFHHSAGHAATLKGDVVDVDWAAVATTGHQRPCKWLGGVIATQIQMLMVGYLPLRIQHRQALQGFEQIHPRIERVFPGGQRGRQGQAMPVFNQFSLVPQRRRALPLQRLSIPGGDLVSAGVD